MRKEFRLYSDVPETVDWIIIKFRAYHRATERPDAAMIDELEAERDALGDFVITDRRWDEIHRIRHKYV